MHLIAWHGNPAAYHSALKKCLAFEYEFSFNAVLFLLPTNGLMTRALPDGHIFVLLSP